MIGGWPHGIVVTDGLVPNPGHAKYIFGACLWVIELGWRARKTTYISSGSTAARCLIRLT